MAGEKSSHPEPKPKPAAERPAPADAPAPPAEDDQEAGQQTIITQQPSRFEQLVDRVLKKHKVH